MIFCKGAAVTKMQIERNDRETTVVEAMLKVPCAGELLGAAVGLVRAADSNSRTNEGTFALLIKAFSLLKQFAEAVHCLVFMWHQTMRIAVQRNHRILMPKYLRQCLDIHPAFKRPCRKGMA